MKKHILLLILAVTVVMPVLALSACGKKPVHLEAPPVTAQP